MGNKNRNNRPVADGLSAPDPANPGALNDRVPEAQRDARYMVHHAVGFEGVFYTAENAAAIEADVPQERIDRWIEMGYISDNKAGE